MMHHPPFPCRYCHHTVTFELCSDWRDTDHRWLTAMTCNHCGTRHEYPCRKCEWDRARAEELADGLAAMWDARAAQAERDTDDQGDARNA